MKVLYLHQHFKINSGGTRSYEFSKYLTSNNHQVTMITGQKIDRNEYDGIQIKSTNTKYNQQFTFFRRILSFIHFMIKSTLIGIKERKPHVIYATSTPLTIGFPALIISKIKRRPLIFEVRDVWPDVPIELGFIGSKFLQKILFTFEHIIYKNASHIIVLSEGMKTNLLKKGVSEEKLSVITNLSMNNYYDEIAPNKSIGFKDKLVCIHPGTMGVVNGLDFILDVAENYPNNDIVYLLIGEGNKKESLIKRIENKDIQNVYIKDALPKDEVMKEIVNSDVGIMTVADYEILHDNSANKFFDYLAAGKPVVINYGGWQQRILEQNMAGKAFNHEDKEGFYRFLVDLKNDQKKRDKYGRNAKKLATNYYDSQLLAGKLEEILNKVVKKADA